MKVSNQTLTLIFAPLVLVIVLIASIVHKPASQTSPQPSSTPTSSATSQVILLEGSITCLPHPNTGAAQSDVCMIGLKTNTGQYYALRDSDPQYSNISSVSSGVPVSVMGTLETQDTGLYMVVGRILVQSITEIK